MYVCLCVWFFLSFSHFMNTCGSGNIMLMRIQLYNIENMKKKQWYLCCITLASLCSFSFDVNVNEVINNKWAMSERNKVNVCACTPNTKQNPFFSCSPHYYLFFFSFHAAFKIIFFLSSLFNTDNQEKTHFTSVFVCSWKRNKIEKRKESK